MDKRISESELDVIDIKFVQAVRVASPNTRDSGIEVAGVAVLPVKALFVETPLETEPSRYHQLIVEVADPESAETQERIRSKFMARWSEKV